MRNYHVYKMVFVYRWATIIHELTRMAETATIQNGTRKSPWNQQCSSTWWPLCWQPWWSKHSIWIERAWPIMDIHQRSAIISLKMRRLKKRFKWVIDWLLVDRKIALQLSTRTNFKLDFLHIIMSFCFHSHKILHRLPCRISINGITYQVMWCQLCWHFFSAHGRIVGDVNCRCCLASSANWSTRRWYSSMFIIVSFCIWVNDKKHTNIVRNFLMDICSELATRICYLYRHHSGRAHRLRRGHIRIGLCLYRRCDHTKGAHTPRDHPRRLLSQCYDNWNCLRYDHETNFGQQTRDYFSRINLQFLFIRSQAPIYSATLWIAHSS